MAAALPFSLRPLTEAEIQAARERRGLFANARIASRTDLPALALDGDGQTLWLTPSWEGASPPPSEDRIALMRSCYDPTPPRPGRPGNRPAPHSPPPGLSCAGRQPA